MNTQLSLLKKKKNSGRVIPKLPDSVRAIYASSFFSSKKNMSPRNAQSGDEILFNATGRNGNRSSFGRC